MPSKKARGGNGPKTPVNAGAATSSKKPRPLSKGPRIGRPGNAGKGKKFEKGQNSHDGATFRRGPDKIPRGSGLLMLRTVMLDRRQVIYDSLCDLVKTPKGAHDFIKDLTDRVDGKPKQTVDHNVRRSTTFGPAPAVEPSVSELPSDGQLVGPDGEALTQL